MRQTFAHRKESTFRTYVLAVITRYRRVHKVQNCRSIGLTEQFHGR
jgi:hypothetical protein